MENLTNFLTISETKIDGFFKHCLFEAGDYKLQRQDCDIHGGGIAKWVKSDLVARQCKDLESKQLTPAQFTKQSLWIQEQIHLTILFL